MSMVEPRAGEQAAILTPEEIVDEFPDLTLETIRDARVVSGLRVIHSRIARLSGIGSVVIPFHNSVLSR